MQNLSGEELGYGPVIMKEKKRPKGRGFEFLHIQEGM